MVTFPPPTHQHLGMTRGRVSHTYHPYTRGGYGPNMSETLIPKSERPQETSSMGPGAYNTEDIRNVKSSDPLPTTDQTEQTCPTPVSPIDVEQLYKSLVKLGMLNQPKITIDTASESPKAPVAPHDEDVGNSLINVSNEVTTEPPKKKRKKSSKKPVGECDESF